MSLRLGATVALLFAACSSSPATDDDAGADGETLCGYPDTDGDTINDTDEGGYASVDTDGDTTPDFRDLDSDGDTFPDAEEAMPLGPCARPGDSDGDTTPDFRDLDSDDNGILDRDEPDGDLDGDTTPDRADTDDDWDGIHDVVELGADPADPLDSDGDGTPDFRDDDSDGDTIPDRIEGTYDADGDTVPNFRDLDSDEDGIPDATEGWGDTDEDRTPDYVDSDSDNDGVADWFEAERGTNPVERDTDGDGATDLVEQAAETDPLDPLDSPDARGTLVFVEEPYEAPVPDRSVVALGVPATPAGTFAVSSEILDDPSDDVDARVFVWSLGTNTTGERVLDATTGVERVCAPTDPPPEDSDGDGVADLFPAVAAGMSVCFDVVAAYNEYTDRVEADIVFAATLRVLADGVTVLAERDVFFLVPYVVWLEVP